MERVLLVDMMGNKNHPVGVRQLKNVIQLLMHFADSKGRAKYTFPEFLYGLYFLSGLKSIRMRIAR